MKILFSLLIIILSLDAPGMDLESIEGEWVSYDPKYGKLEIEFNKGRFSLMHFSDHIDANADKPTNGEFEIIDGIIYLLPASNTNFLWSHSWVDAGKFDNGCLITPLSYYKLVNGISSIKDERSLCKGANKEIK